MATKINVRSPFHIKVSQTNIATATLDLYVYTGTFVANASVANPKFTITKSVVTSGYITFEIAELVRDYLDITFDGTYTSQSVWVNAVIATTVSSGSASATVTPDNTNGFLALDGYGYFEEGINPSLSTTLLQSNKGIRVVQGGTSASKTFGIIALLIDRSIKIPKTETSVVAESIPHLRRGAVRDFKKIMQMTGRWHSEQFNKTLLTYTFANGSTIEFFSADSDAKLRGARRHVCYINECNNISHEAYFQLAVRTSKHIYLDFNPSAEFWAHTELKDDPDAEWLILTYKDNQAAPKAAVKEILKAKQKADKGNNFWQNWYRVYGLGLVGTLQGAVFTNWKEGKFKEVSKAVYGQDFGFSNDPTTLIKTSIDKDKKLIYLQECFYKKGLTTSQIATLNQKHAGNDLIVADSAEPRLIQELSQYCNIVPTIKGQGSITFGISLLQDYDLIVDPDSEELIKELKNYVWLEKRSQTPCDAFNHLLDALRYSVSYQLANPHRGEYFVY